MRSLYIAPLMLHGPASSPAFSPRRADLFCETFLIDDARRHARVFPIARHEHTVRREQLARRVALRCDADCEVVTRQNLGAYAGLGSAVFLTITGRRCSTFEAVSWLRAQRILCWIRIHWHVPHAVQLGRLAEILLVARAPPSRVFGIRTIVADELTGTLRGFSANPVISMAETELRIDQRAGKIRILSEILRKGRRNALSAGAPQIPDGAWGLLSSSSSYAR